MKKIALHWQIFIAFIISVLLGLFLTEIIPYIKWFGIVFLWSLKIIVIPLILTSIITGIINNKNISSLGRLGAKTIVYYISTSILAILTGLFFVNILQPGINADLGLKEEINELSSNNGGFKILYLIIFALITGIIILFIKGKFREKITFFMNRTNNMIMRITEIIIKFSPLGILGIVAVKVSEIEDFGSTLKSLGLYMAAVIAALSFHSMVSLPLIVRYIAKVNPFLHFRNLSSVLITAFSTSSSSATLPLTMESLEHKTGVSNRVASFTLPLGATINMDGTALYECIAVIFIAQAYGIELSFIQQLLVILTALMASIGAAGIPMAGLMMIGIILQAVHLPLEGIGLILAVDRILDMFRTTVNVWSDSCGAVLIAKSEGETLAI